MSLDKRLLRVARTCGHTPAVERAVARFSMLGEHAGVWLALGSAESLLTTGEQRVRWRRATAVVAGTYAANTVLKLVVRRVRPDLPGLPPGGLALSRTSLGVNYPSDVLAGALLGTTIALACGPPRALDGTDAP
jgi:hypothetical protein